jgi:hypothetical protein
VDIDGALADEAVYRGISTIVLVFVVVMSQFLGWFVEFLNNLEVQFYISV